MKEQFLDLNFHPKTLARINLANEIIRKLQALGYTLTLRQLYYRLVAADIIPNSQKEYKKLGETLNNARLAGLIDWDAIEDRTRRLRALPHWLSPKDIVAQAAEQYAVDKWSDQDHRVEVWVEKDALVGVLEKACNELDVPFFSCRGYGSQTALYDAGKRILRHIRDEKEPIIVHLGDHDPSGCDMTRDITDRLELFVGRRVHVERIALNMDQVEEHHLPPNPAKSTDSRFGRYSDEHGHESWELDALEPQLLHSLITETVLKYRDESRWSARLEEESAQRKGLETASARWGDVTKFLKTHAKNHDKTLKANAKALAKLQEDLQKTKPNRKKKNP